jgi:hypothetical protein
MDTDQLAQAILSLYEAEQFRQEIARAGRAAIQKIIGGASTPTYSEAIAELLAMMQTGSTKPVAATA